MLVNEHNGNILPLPGELVKRLFDRRVVGFAVDDEVVLLRLGGFGDVL